MKIKTGITFNAAELQSKSSRIKWAEGLILQLPYYHDGRNSWLLNYGTGEEAVLMRKERHPKELQWDDETDSCELATGGGK